VNIVFAWIILGAVVAVFSFGLPFLQWRLDTWSYNGYWKIWRGWNAVLWGLLFGAGLMSLGIVWSLHQIGALG
jgi:hypothetical protein